MKFAMCCAKSGLALLAVLVATGCNSIANDSQSQPLPEALRVAKNITLAGAIDGYPESELRQSDTLVIDLRMAEEEGAAEQSIRLSRGGIRHVSFPMGREIPTSEQVGRFEDILSENGDRPVLLHCSSGNRAGLLWAAHLIEQGMQVEEAVTLVRPIANREETQNAIRNYVKGGTR